MDQILTIIAAAISGGVFTAIVNYLTAKRNGKKDDFQVIVDQWKEDNDRLRKQLDDMSHAHESEKKEMQGEINALRREVAMLEGKVNVLERIKLSPVKEAD